MLKRPRGSCPTTICDKCCRSISTSNFRKHHAACSGKRVLVTKKETNARYYIKHKEEIAIRKQIKRARVEYDEMDVVKQTLDRLRSANGMPPFPNLQAPELSVLNPLRPLIPYQDLYLAVVEAMTNISDKYELMSKRWMQKLLSKCHTDKYEGSLIKPRHNEERALWFKAMTNFTQSIIATMQEACYVDLVAQDLKDAISTRGCYLDRVTQWKQRHDEIVKRSCTQNEGEIKKCEAMLIRWKDYKHCNAFDEFKEVWLGFYKMTKKLK